MIRVLQGIRGNYTLPPRYAHVSAQTKHKDTRDWSERMWLEIAV